MYAERPSTRVPGAVLWSVTASGAGGSGAPAVSTPPGESTQDPAQDVLPDGCMDLVWSAGRLLVAGPDTRAHPSDPMPAGAAALGIRLPPGAAPVLLGVPADALRDARPELADVWGARAARPWADAVAEGGSAALEHRVAALLAERGGRPREAAVVTGLAARASSAADIADRLGVTPRTLHRRSLAAFGYGPRTLGRVLRLQRVLPLLDAGVPLAEIAQRAGYADQPHLSREVRALTGRSPAALAAGRAGAAASA
ncbi:helix-turn-helix transcriptional regulator [Cellulomonas sp. Y8]|uniref:helix-turn-helix transcriptional regulator n=1 Tax=Cellulomonas sp. Y8 TaxID=2591145 RepID=UPI0011C9D3C6|nr:helix-turn-helix transcriptional regulator [Cellulomonas sp. Y8]